MKFFRGTLLALSYLSSLPWIRCADTESIRETASCGVVQRSHDLYKLRTCLYESFPPSEERYGFYRLPKVTFQGDEDYYVARKTGRGGNPQPQVVVMAESTDDVIAAVECAVYAGYRIAPRGRGHSYQALSSANGYVVIDCSLLCNPEEFNWSHEGGDWILPGQKYIGSVESGSGCTNAVMAANTAKEFAPEEGALFSIGTCPSVGITGYLLGGGAGDITPYTGWGSDDVLELKYVVWNGTNAEEITANRKENKDLFWASLGGGGGMGVITSIKTAIIQSPEPPSKDESRKFLFFQLGPYDTSDEEKLRKVITPMYNFFYKVDPKESSKFGGSGSMTSEVVGFVGIYMGGADEFVQSMSKHGLIDEELFPKSSYPSFVKFGSSSSAEFVCDGRGPCRDWPKFQASLVEFDSYGDTIIFKICHMVLSEPSRFVGMTQTTGDLCNDLGISSEYCVEKDFLGKQVFTPICEKREVLDAVLEAAVDPLSFMNQGGYPEWSLKLLRPQFESADDIGTTLGGLLVPDVGVDALVEIAKLGPNELNHLQHGAPTQLASDATALPHRDTPLMFDFIYNADKMQAVVDILSKHYKDGWLGLQGYYNYLAPKGNPNWGRYYFGDNYEKIKEVKLKYDASNYFGNDFQVEPAIPKKDDFNFADFVYFRGAQG